jgi:hypothetical protein
LVEFSSSAYMTDTLLSRVKRIPFNFKVAHLQLTHGQTIDALDKDKLCPTDTANALHWIIRFVL